VRSDKYYTGCLGPPPSYLLNQNWGLESRPFQPQVLLTPLSFRRMTAPPEPGSNLGAYFFKKQKALSAALRLNMICLRQLTSSYYRVLLAALYPATDKLKFNAFVDVLSQPFDHPFFNGSNFGHRRYDAVLIFGLQATCEIYKGLEFNVHYFLTRDDSNIALYDYSRHIVGCQLGYRY
jgi:hypothetical protein